MTTKSIFLGAAASLAVLCTAQAADLPMTKGEAVEYVKVCSTFGPGFFYIPGSDTCLQIGGEIRADYRVFGGNSPAFGGRSVNFNRNDDRSAFNTQARIWFDARTQTDWGLLRSYFQINADSHPIDAQGRGAVYNDNTFTIDKAFIQFGGLTAGYAHSFFGFYDNEWGDTIWAPYYAQSNTVNLVAYTAQFGSGLSATLSIEDGRDHRQNSFYDANGVIIQGGQQVPDIVGQVRYDAGWGSLAAQAAAHQYRSADLVEDGVVVPPAAGGIPRENKLGFAVGGTALINIPAIDGGHLIVEAQYADGALDYLGASNSVLGAQDYFFTGAGRFDGGKGWSVVAELGGNITDQWNANLVGSYIDTSYNNAVVSPAGGLVDYKLKELTIAGNLTYTVVKGLTIAAEVAYTRVEQNNIPDSIVEPVTLVDDKANIWQAGIRVKRVF